MEPKKNPKYDVHRKSGMIFSFSLGCSLLIVITALEWETPFDRTLIEPTVLTKVTTQIDYPSITVIDPPSATTAPKPKQIKMPDPSRIVTNTSTQQTQKDFNIDQLQPGPANSLGDTTLIIDIPAEPTQIICLFPEKQAEPQNGYEDFYRQLRKNLKYPAKARRMNTQGKVYVQFIVDQKGEMSDVKIMKGIGDGCDEEAMRVLALTKWNPGKQRGTPVKVKMVLPITFSLNSY